MSATLVKVVCAVCTEKIGDVVATENGYALIHRKRIVDEDPSVEPRWVKERHVFTADDPAVWTTCPNSTRPASDPAECFAAGVYWTLDDEGAAKGKRIVPVREKLGTAQREGRTKTHAVGHRLKRD